MGQNPVTSFGWLDWQIAGNCVDGTCQVTNQSESINCQTGTKLLAGSSVSHSGWSSLFFYFYQSNVTFIKKKKTKTSFFCMEVHLLFTEILSTHTFCKFVDNASKSVQADFASV